MSVDVFIKSYRNDFWLLYLSLATIKKNVTGYNTLNLLIPEKDKELFDTRQLPDRTFVHYVPDAARGWLKQQHYKMTAHKFCYAEYILFSDSDNFFDHPIDVQDLIKDGKPEILFTDYNQLPDAIIWKDPTEKFIGEPQQFEFMRRLPLVYHRSTLEAIEKFKPDLESIIMKADNQRFSEFNAIGSFCYKFEKEKYNFINTDDWTYVAPHSSQVWSHASKREGASELHLREYIRTLETLLKSFGIVTP